MPVHEFPISAIEKLEYYVYSLTDPETKQVFYIGKGIGNRVFAHANAAISSPTPGEKLDRIREIQANGLSVEHEILRHGLTEKEAFEVEAALIDYAGIETLTNLVLGINSDERGRMSVGDIIEKYAAPELSINEPVLLIRVNRLYRKGMSDEELFAITQGNWVVGTRREKAHYAFAVYKGIVRAVYAIETWHPVVTNNPAQKNRHRWRFEGRTAPELQHYVGGSTIHYATLGVQNPILYINC